MKYFYIIVWLFTRIKFGSTELYSSMAHIEDCLSYVKRMNISEWIMKHFVQPEELRIETLKKIVKKSIDIDKLLDEDKKEADHPVNTYRVIKNVADFKENLKEATSNFSTFKEASFIKFLNFLPTKEDLNGSIAGLARLQVVYDLSFEEVMSGTINGKPSRPLTAEEVLDIATFTVNLSIPGLQINNYTMSWLIHINNTGAVTNNRKLYIKLLRMMSGIYIQNRCSCSIELQHVYNSLRKVDPSYYTNIERFSKNCKQFHECKLLKVKPATTDINDRFISLCRGEQIQIPEESIGYKTPAHELNCIRQHNNDPRLLLSPVRVEVLNKKNPYIAVLHDIVTDTEINALKRVAKPVLKRGTVKVREGQAKSNTKISKTMLIPNSHITPYSKLHAFRNRLVALTKLNHKSFKKVEVANYGLGGIYNVHVDFLIPRVEAKFTEATDVNLLTIVNYLTDVENGGMTVFPQLGIKAGAKKGNALLFYNLFRNGTGNRLTVHASCPVLYGNKWIANQWVQRNEQTFAYPCSLNKYE